MATAAQNPIHVPNRDRLPSMEGIKPGNWGAKVRGFPTTSLLKAPCHENDRPSRRTALSRR